MKKKERIAEAERLITKYGLAYAESVSAHMCSEYYHMSFQYAEVDNDKHRKYCERELANWLKIDDYICNHAKRKQNG